MKSQTYDGLSIHIRGIVQGVGFRPFVFQSATKHGLTGWVKNTSNGVEIIVNGEPDALEQFYSELKSSPPPLARIDSITRQSSKPEDFSKFDIIESSSDPAQFIPVSPDISICNDCLSEMRDKNNRRYRYPFINCTNCGPRFSIIKDIPYDRPSTTMSGFKLCPDCGREYKDPMDRRFHAQPTACSICGPELSFVHYDLRINGNEESLFEARNSLKKGMILAVKGLGGYHLVCDAQNESSVEELRIRKNRVEKPFALMASTVESIEKYCEVSSAEKELLESRQRPIVLLGKRKNCTLPVSLAPGQSTLGFMLPYTPLHYLLLENSHNFPEILVMTSGNLSEEPIAFTDEDAFSRLKNIADGFLFHNREIHMRVDDSVMRIMENKQLPIRRSRGFAPDPITLPYSVKPILAVGAQLKNHFTLTRDSYAFHSHYIGDLENYETFQSFKDGISHYEKLFRITPEVIACDLHPDYLSTRYANERSKTENISLIQVQHHHAHMAACLAENGWETDEPVIGLTFDGTGYGTDGTIWGGEILVGGYKTFTRRFHLSQFPLPGGEAAVRVPARSALSILHILNLEWQNNLSPVKHFSKNELEIVKSQLQKRINCPLTSSMGRLFDAVSSLIGIRQSVTYEGQAAIELESVSDPGEQGFYEISIKEDNLDYEILFKSILLDLSRAIPVDIIAARFHNSIIRMCFDICNTIRNETGISTVAISGGVWQNSLLFTKANKLLFNNGFNVLTHKILPTNDACISMGQAVIANSIYQ